MQVVIPKLIDQGCHSKKLNYDQVCLVSMYHSRHMPDGTGLQQTDISLCSFFFFLNNILEPNCLLAIKVLYHVHQIKLLLITNDWMLSYLSKC